LGARGAVEAGGMDMSPATLFFTGVAAWILGWGVTLGMAWLAQARNDRHAFTLLDDDTINHDLENKK